MLRHDTFRFVQQWENVPVVFYFVFGATVRRLPAFLDHTQSLGLLWTRDRPFAEALTWQHATLRRDTCPCPRRDFVLLSRSRFVLYPYYFFVLIVLNFAVFLFLLYNTQNTNIYALGGTSVFHYLVLCTLSILASLSHRPAFCLFFPLLTT
jgi:hypothetical protein